MAKISVIFKEAHLKEVIAGAKVIGDHVLPDNYLGPEFEDAAIEPAGIEGMVLIKPNDKEVAYIYNTSDIARIRVERIKESVTPSGIVVARPAQVQQLRPKH